MSADIRLHSLFEGRWSIICEGSLISLGSRAYAHVLIQLSKLYEYLEIFYQPHRSPWTESTLLTVKEGAKIYYFCDEDR
jgi:hypothetical protein